MAFSPETVDRWEDLMNQEALPDDTSLKEQAAQFASNVLIKAILASLTADQRKVIRLHLNDAIENLVTLQAEAKYGSLAKQFADINLSALKDSQKRVQDAEMQ